MTVKQIVTELKSKGYSVSYRVRKDGGILITSIDGQKFKGASGNKMARLLTGRVISLRREKQLKKITRERVVKPRKIPIETPVDLERYRKRVMRKWRKAGLTGSIGKKNLRKIIEERGFKGAETYLQEMERYTEGKAYYSLTDTLLARIKEDMKLAEENEKFYLQTAYDLILDNREDMRPAWVFAIFDELYKWEKSQISASAFYLSVQELLS